MIPSFKYDFLMSKVGHLAFIFQVGRLVAAAIILLLGRERRESISSLEMSGWTLSITMYRFVVFWRAVVGGRVVVSGMGECSRSFSLDSWEEGKRRVWPVLVVTTLFMGVSLRACLSFS